MGDAGSERGFVGAVQVKTNVTNTANSLNIRKLMQQPRKGKAMADFMMADEGAQKPSANDDDFHAWLIKLGRVVVVQTVTVW